MFSWWPRAIPAADVESLSKQSLTSSTWHFLQSKCCRFFGVYEPGTGLNPFHRSTQSTNNHLLSQAGGAVILSLSPRTCEKCLVGPDVAPEGLALDHPAALPTPGLAHNAQKVSVSVGLGPRPSVSGAVRPPAHGELRWVPFRDAEARDKHERGVRASGTRVGRGSSFSRNMALPHLRSCRPPDWEFDWPCPSAINEDNGR